VLVAYVSDEVLDSWFAGSVRQIKLALLALWRMIFVQSLT